MKKTGQYARHKLVDDLLKWGWPVERLDEIEYSPDKGNPDLPGMKYFDLKKLWQEWRKGNRRLETAKAIGADDQQAAVVARWSGKALDTVRKACARADVPIGRRQELVSLARASLQGILSNPAFSGEDPVVTAKRAVTYAKALSVEVNAALHLEAQRDAINSVA